ncbi:MAG: sn-glycerol-1-phosphate dehydrogenase, partial [Eubacteriales bacterium]|nr:sn-glycerol-1-phosphate dehydrogenase [Eubacteriales bacterium]
MRDHKTDEMHTPDIEELMGKSFECPECGRIHSMDTRKLIIGEGLFGDISREIDELGLKGKGLIVCDRNTYKAAGCRLIENLADRDVSLFVFEREDLHADAHSVGRLMIAMADDPAYLIACGSGTITDTVRYVAFLTKKPFIVFATAASVDGFASGSTPLIVDGFKTTYPGKAPLAVLADTEVLAAAPRKMTAAGFGDVLAKIVAVIDWKLAREVGGELFCPLICRMVEKAVDDCISLSGELAKADPQACGKLMRVLSMTGIAMQMMGTTRPASGGEHHISHLLEMKDIRLGRRGSLHGDKVGIGTLISLYMYREMFGAHSMPEQKAHLSEKAWTEEIRRVFGDVAER